MKFTGRAHRFEDNIDTDMIIPAHFLGLSRPEQAKHAFENIAPDFPKKAKRGDLIVAGRNFGCGSARPSHRVLIDNGISAVIATSFATLFLRSAVDEGLPLFKCPEAWEGIAEGDQVEADMETGKIRNLTRGTEFQAERLPEFLREIIARGGLLAYAREKVQEIAKTRREVR